jgi:carboxylesterase
MIIPGAEPFFFPGGPQGCLLIHGFTGAPREMRDLGVYLSRQGFSVLGVRLVGHGTRIEDLTRTRWQDWLACVEDGYHLLKGSADQVTAVGLSLGGILSLTFASRRFTPECPVAGVVAMSVPHHLPIDERLLPYLKLASIVKSTRMKGHGDWFDKQAERQNISYPADSIRGAVEVQNLIREMLICLPMLTAPTRLIYSKDDQTVHCEDRHADQIFSLIGSQEKDLRWIENSGHNITCDAQRHTVYELTAEFIHAHATLPV